MIFMATKLLRICLEMFATFQTGEVFQIVQGLPKDAKVMCVRKPFPNNDIELEVWSEEFKGDSEEWIELEITRFDNRKYETQDKIQYEIRYISTSWHDDYLKKSGFMPVHAPSYPFRTEELIQGEIGIYQNIRIVIRE